jgi:thymidine phosphorylase
VRCLAKPGERVERGQPLLELLTDEESRFDQAAAGLAGAVTVGDRPPDVVPLIIDHL